MKKVFYLFTGSLLAVFLFSYSQVFAASPEYTFLRTSTGARTFDYEVRPGSQIKDSVTLQNLDGTRQITLRLSVAEFSSDTLRPLLSEWVKLDSSEVVLQPKESKVVGFEVNLPEDLEDFKYGTLFSTVLGKYDDPTTSADAGGSGVAIKATTAIAANIVVQVNSALEASVAENGDVSTEDSEAVNGGSGEEKLSNKIYNFVADYLDAFLIVIIIILLLKIYSLNQQLEQKGTGGVKVKK